MDNANNSSAATAASTLVKHENLKLIAERVETAFRFTAGRDEHILGNLRSNANVGDHFAMAILAIQGLSSMRADMFEEFENIEMGDQQIRKLIEVDYDVMIESAENNAAFIEKFEDDPDMSDLILTSHNAMLTAYRGIFRKAVVSMAFEDRNVV